MNSRYYKIFLFIVIAALHQLSASAQDNIIISGSVTDETDQLVPGVNVIVVNDLDRVIGGTITDFNGNYRISVADVNYKLHFSFIGYKTQKFDINNKSIINVKIVPDSQSVDEVVVVAEKQSMDPFNPVNIRDMSAAVERLEMRDIENLPSVSLADALQGQMANMDIVSSSGEPGAGMSIRIRGTTSLNASSEPLFVIDGIPYDTSVDDDFDFGTANEDDFGALVNLPPEDIKSIQVLKDGATAIWGSRGANGVVMIETRRGNKGKTRVTYSLKTSLNVEPDQIPMLTGDEYATYIQESFWNNYFTNGWATAAGHMQLMNIGFDDLGFNPDYQYYDEYNQNTNWTDEISRNGYGHSHNISVSGGGDKARYRLSLNYADEQGVTKGAGMSRYGTVWNVDYNISNRLVLSSNFNLMHTDRMKNYEINNDVARLKLRQVAANRMPNASPYLIDDATGLPTNVYFQRQSDFQGTSLDGYYNPLAMINAASHDVALDQAVSSLKLRYNITDPLTYNFVIGMNYTTTQEDRFLPQEVTGIQWSNVNANKAQDVNKENFNVNTSNMLIYRPGIGEAHQLTLTGGITTTDKRSTTYQSVLSGFGSGTLADPSSEAKIRSVNSGASRSRYIGFVSNVHYMLKDTYIFGGGVNYEGNSKFGPAERWSLFPNVSAGWRVSNMNFMESLGFIDELKVRGSWGQSGNPPTQSYAYAGAYTADGSYMDMGVIKPKSIQLNGLKAETVTNENIGLNFEAFQRKLVMNFDVYRRTTEDMLQKNGNLPSTTGYEKVAFLNYGTMRNSGWEFFGNYTPIRTKNWRVKFNWNVAQNKNTVLDMPENIDLDPYTFGNGRYANRVEIGNALGSFYGYIYDGVYSTKDETIVRGQNGQKVSDIGGNPVYMTANNYTFQAGDAKYRDTNNDGVINEYDMVYLGNAMPKVTGGFGTQVTFKKSLSLNVFFHGRVGQSIINQRRMDTENMYTRNNQSAAVLSRWRQEGDQTDVPRALYNTGFNWLGSSRFVEDGSYLRLKTVTLSYNFPKSMIQNIGLNRVKLFVTGYDLFTFTNYTGQDPEVFVGGKDIFALGRDRSATPRPKRFALGLNVEF